MFRQGYSPGFTERKKKEVKRRDGWKCIVCGIPESEHLDVVYQKLSTHHVDCDRVNHDTTNLVALCNLCHKSAHSEEKEGWMDYFREYIGRRCQTVHLGFSET